MGRCWWLMILGVAWLAPAVLRAEEAGAGAPASVEALWADFDPRAEALDVRVVREWQKDGIVYRYVTYHVGSFKGRAARMAAFFAFPQGARGLPGLLHLHGGGQRAFLHEVELHAKRGYACLSINWGGPTMEGAQEGEPNTDWGAVDPTQKNVAGYANLKPGDRYLDPFESPRNNNWYLLTLGARRGLTFLEQQPEVDAGLLGVYGHSMGGSLTVYVAGTDNRVKAAVPAVGGSGFRTAPWPLLPVVTLERPNGDVKLFDATIGFESYAAHIHAPMLWLGSTNDFHGIMDDTYRTGAVIPHQDTWYSFAPHLNHRFTPEFSVNTPLWFDQYLKGRRFYPKTPDAVLVLRTESRIAELRVTPDSSQPVAEVRLYYSIDPDPRARFWRSAEAMKVGENWVSPLPILSVDQPLFAFANVSYGLPPGETTTLATDRFTISSMLQTASPSELRASGVEATDKADGLVDDFAHGWCDWYLLEPRNPHHWEFSTRKVTDPKWRGQPGQRLSLEVQAEKSNALVVILTENFFRGYRGKSREFVAVVTLRGGEAAQVVSLEPKDFTASDGEALSTWGDVDLLTFRAYHERGDKLLGSKSWSGPQPVFRKLWWEGEGR